MLAAPGGSRQRWRDYWSGLCNPLCEQRGGPIEVNVNAAPSEEASKVEALVQTFDSVFANDPLRDEWRQFGEKGAS